MPPATTRTRFGAKLETAFREAGYDTQKQIAAVLDVSQPTVSEWLREPGRYPDRELWPEIERICGLDEGTVYLWTVRLTLSHLAHMLRFPAHTPGPFRPPVPTSA